MPTWMPTMLPKQYLASISADTLLPRALRALVSVNEHLTLDFPERVVYNAFYEESKVSTISSGANREVTV
ncbi:hypothetical protein POX_c04647 [Penicillium oxalicum]|uniref:hypothetical protein n=1 Tax=Penicillium oxalicum TaxID=69781 RepID=UPI0020B67641|nr:hypothetical protein POX_c04647 [Penicillium oxalicum]KAI2791768.1 hypothetical protein POX_c04647 [Penicillium oxalicum]